MKNTYGFVFLLLSFIIALGICRSYAQEIGFDENRLKALDQYFQKGLKEWDIPGMAVAIVYNDSVIFAKGYGLRNIEKDEKVDEYTVFGIASNTKAFTAAALAVLVDEGRLKWDDKVTDYLPYFRMYDTCTTLELTVRDLLCHRSGLETFSGDLLWNATTYNRKEILERIRYLKPKYPFRYNYGYSNLMFLAAGEIVQAVTDTSYDDFLRKRFFDPIGMNVTNTSISKFENIDNLAVPHAESNGKNIPIKYISWDNIAPAGAINSNVMEMSEWMRLQLNHGFYKGKQFFSESASSEMWKPHTLIDLSSTDEYLMPSIHFRAYGLGWNMFDFHGRKIINHSGGLDGMISQVVLVPEERMGFIVLTNSINYLPYALMYKVIDDFMGIDGNDYSATFLKIINTNKEFARQEIEQDEEKRDKNAKPTLPLEEYTGIYGGDLYGDAKISLENGKLKLQMIPTPLYVSELNYWQNEVFQVEFKNFPSLPCGRLKFYISSEGEVTEFKIDVPNPDFDFTELEFKKIK